MANGFFRPCRSAMRLAPAGVIVFALAANLSCAPAPAQAGSQPAAREHQPQTEPRSNEMAKLEAADALVTVESRSGCVVWLRVGKPLRTVARGRPAALLEVTDLRAGRTYHPMRDKFDLTGWKATGAAGKRTVTFTQQYEGAPFRVVQKFRETPAGVRWEASLKLLPGHDQCRSLRVAWVLPAPRGWSLWSPQDTHVRRNDGVTPQRYVYGHISFRPYGTMIPLVATWGRQGGLAAFSPPDIQKPYISFDLDTQSAPTPVRGIAMGRDDLPKLRVTHHMVGLRPGKALKLAVCLAGIKPDWRSALASYVNAYPKLFEPVPATRKVEGMYGITNPTRAAAGHLDKMKAAGVTFAEVHGHFPEYSIYMTREALKDPKLTWRCKPHPGDKLSLAGNRECIRKLNAAGIAAFMYWYNCHARLATIKKLWGDDLMRDEKGRPMLKWHTEPSMHASPDAPYGKHLMEQMDLLIKAYPKAAGFFVDNYAIEMIDFAHDDGVTMVHNRPAYDMNRNHQTIGPPCFVKAHKAGKIIMVNKISTIESLRGADMVLAETRGVTSIRKHALACVFRPLFPLGMEVPPGPHGPERGFQHLLLNGCFADEALYHKDPKTAEAYRPLTDTMIGKRWVLEFDPLTIAMTGGDLPDGVEAQIFRIDKAAPKGGSVVVVVADLNASWKDTPATKGLTVTVRLAGRARLKKATWLAVEASGGAPVTCKLTRKAKSLTVALPPVGAAGILRLSP